MLEAELTEARKENAELLLRCEELEAANGKLDFQVNGWMKLVVQYRVVLQEFQKKMEGVK